jgi:hypothetical protein
MMNHISFLDAIILTAQVLGKIVCLFGPFALLGVLGMVLVEVLEARR